MAKKAVLQKTPVQKRLFSITQERDFRELLIKKSLFWVFGRYAQGRPILYTLFNRLMLIFQSPISIIVYDDPLKTVDSWTNDAVFKSLRLADDKTDAGFGDQEFAQVFERQLNELNLTEPLSDFLFSFFGARYRIVFFHNNYKGKGWNLKNLRFEPISRQSDYGKILQKILENDGQREDQSLDPLLYFGNDFTRALDQQLAKQFSEFNTIKKVNLEEIILDDPKQQEIIEQSISLIRNRVVNSIYKSRIETSPFYVRSYEDNDGGYNLINAFFFLKIATSNREIGANHFPYTLRLILSDKQRSALIQHYGLLEQNKNHCIWYKNGRCRALEHTLKDKNQCIIESDKLSPADIVMSAERPFTHERDFMDVAMGNGNISHSVPYPDLLRSRSAETLPTEHQYTGSMTIRQAAMLCLSFQSVRADRETLNSKDIRLKAIAVPIHVGGIASASMLVIVLDDPKHPEKTWLEIYSITLSSLLRTVYSNIRTELKKTYLYELSRIIEHSLVKNIETAVNGWYVKPGPMVEDINEKIKLISHIYPFPIIMFSSKEKSHDNKDSGITAMAIGKTAFQFSFKITKNLYFSRLFSLNYIGPDEIEDQFSIAVHRAVPKINKKTNNGKRS